MSTSPRRFTYFVGVMNTLLMAFVGTQTCASSSPSTSTSKESGICDALGGQKGHASSASFQSGHVFL